MEEDPLPEPEVRLSSQYSVIKQRDIKKIVAIVLCLFLGLALILCPQMIIEQSQNELGILKFNLGINQAPRAIIFGALAVLPQKFELNSVSLPQVWETDRGTTEASLQKSKNWIIMVWYGSTYG